MQGAKLKLSALHFSCNRSSIQQIIDREPDTALLTANSDDPNTNVFATVYVIPSMMLSIRGLTTSSKQTRTGTRRQMFARFSLTET